MTDEKKEAERIAALKRQIGKIRADRRRKDRRNLTRRKILTGAFFLEKMKRNKKLHAYFLKEAPEYIEDKNRYLFPEFDSPQDDRAGASGATSDQDGDRPAGTAQGKPAGTPGSSDQGGDRPAGAAQGKPAGTPGSSDQGGDRPAHLGQRLNPTEK